MATAAEVLVLFKGDTSDLKDKAESTKGIVGGLLSSIPTMAAGGLLAIGGLGAGIAALGLDSAGQAIQGQRELQAQLGITSDYAQELGGLGKEVFADNWGGSIGEATTAVGQFARAFNFDIAKEDLKVVTEQALAFGSNFDLATSDVERGVANVTAAFTDAAAAPTKILDAMTVLQQTGGQRADDLIDTLQEYSPLMSQLGMSSDQFFGVLNEGLTLGARNTDLVADLFKEYGIRIADGSKTTKDALSSLGLGNLTAELSAGKITGAEAFDTINKAITSIDDPIQRNVVGVALMGTKYEDLGQEIVSGLSIGKDALTNFEGAALDAGNATSSNLGAMWETIKRHATVALGSVFEPVVLGAQAIGGQLLPIVLPFIDDIGAAFANLSDGDVWSFFGEIGDAVQNLTGLPVAEWFDGVGQVVQPLADRLQVFFDLLASSGDWSSSFGETMQTSLQEAFGIDIGPLVDGLSTLLDVGGSVLGWIDQTIGIGNILLPIIGVALVAAFGALAVAAGSAALGVITALAPVVVPIALIGGVLAILKAAWDRDWGGIQEKVSGVVAWIQANLLPPIQTAFGGIQALLSSLVGWWQQNGDQIIGVVSGIVGFVTTQFGFLFNILSGIVQAGIALITGNWSGLGTALGSILANGINLIVGLVRGLLTSIGNVLGGLRSLMSNLVKGALDSLVSLFKGGSRDSSKSLIDGLIDGIKSGAGRAVSAIVDLGKNLVSSFMANLKIASPSQVFAELGAWITLGLASGIQKEDRKAIDALAGVISGMNSVIGGVQDFASKLLKFVVPSDTQLTEAKGKFTQLLVIFANFAKDMSYLGALVGPNTPNISFAQPGQIATINQGLRELAATLPAVKELQGLQAEDLLTGGEASWVSSLTDIIGKMASTWGSLADNLTKMAAAKMPTDSQLDALKAAAVGVILWAQEVTNGVPPNPVGVSDFGEVVKTASDMLANVAKLNIDKVTALAADKLDVAASNAQAIALAVGVLAAAFVGQGGTAEQRAEFVKGVADYSSFVKSASDILAAGATDKLSEVTALEADRLAVAASNGSLMIDAVAGLVFAFKGAGGSEEQRAALITSVRQYADLVKGAGDILAAGAALALADATDVDGIQLDIASTNAAEMFRSVVLLSTDFRAMADEAQSALADGAKRYAEVVKAAADVLGAGAGLALASAVDVDLVQLDIAEANAKEMERSITMLSETFRRLAEDAQKDLADGAKRYADVVKAAADVLGLGAALNLRDAVMFEWNLLPFIEETVVAIYDSVVRLSEKFRAMGGEEQTNLASGAKLYADIIKAAADVLKAGSSVDLRDAVSFEWNMMGFVEEAVTAIFDSVVRLSEKFRSDNNTEAQKAIVEGAKNYASVVTAAASLFGSVAGSIDKLADIGNPGDLTTKLDTVRGWITILWDQLALIATDITKDEAEAKAAVASAIGTAAKGLGDIGDGISKLLAMETGGLLGADPNRSDLGFMQRVKGRRADFNASVLTDSIKRMVKSLTDALGTLDLPDPKDPKIEALAALGDAFGKLADGVTKLAQAKIPDAKQLEALASVTARAGSLIPAGPALTVAGAGAGASGTTVINQNTINGNVNIIATDKDSLGGIVSSLGSWGRRP